MRAILAERNVLPYRVGVANHGRRQYPDALVVSENLSNARNFGGTECFAVYLCLYIERPI